MRAAGEWDTTPSTYYTTNYYRKRHPYYGPEAPLGRSCRAYGYQKNFQAPTITWITSKWMRRYSGQCTLLGFQNWKMVSFNREKWRSRLRATTEIVFYFPWNPNDRLPTLFSVMLKIVSLGQFNKTYNNSFFEINETTGYDIKINALRNAVTKEGCLSYV